MTLIADIGSGQQIASVWGNAIRNCSTQIFASEAERNAQWGSAPNGAMCVTLDTNTIWLRASGVWMHATPVAYQGGIAGGNLNSGQGMTTGSFTLPSGFRNALIDYQVLIAGGATSVQLKAFTSNGGIQVSQINWYQMTSNPTTFVYSRLMPVNINGDAIIISLANTAGATISTYSDSQNHSLSVVGYP